MRILILGGYGHFGGRIARTLAADGGCEILVAGRNLERARAFIEASGASAAAMRPQRLDIDDPAFGDRLAATGAGLLIHTAGPFQGRDYAVARAALACGMHYIDLADARAFVAGFETLDAQARRAQRRAVTGASSVPGLSAAVVAAHLHRFSRLEAMPESIPQVQDALRRKNELRAHSDITLEDLEVMKRFDWDFRSGAPKPGGHVSQLD